MRLFQENYKKTIFDRYINKCLSIKFTESGAVPVQQRKER
jgi:hypothetical protein